MTRSFRGRVKHWMTRHVQGAAPNILIFSTPRSGSTWLAELIATQGKFKCVNEPFNLRKSVVRENLGLHDWKSLLDTSNRVLMARYMQTFLEGTDTDIRFPRERPFSTFWHPQTDRVIFKILFAGEDSIEWFEREFHGYALFLVRHPLAVSLSRNELPRLESFFAFPFSRHFSQAQLEHARSVIESGDKLQMAVVDWCMQNMVPLRETDCKKMTIFYEQLVMEPELIVNELARRFNLPHPEKMLKRINKPSGSAGMSRKEYRDVLFDETEMRRKRHWLIGRWRDRVSRSEEQAAFETMQMFQIDCYAFGRDLPTEKYLKSG